MQMPTTAVVIVAGPQEVRSVAAVPFAVLGQGAQASACSSPLPVAHALVRQRAVRVGGDSLSAATGSPRVPHAVLERREAVRGIEAACRGRFLSVVRGRMNGRAVVLVGD